MLAKVMLIKKEKERIEYAYHFYETDFYVNMLSLWLKHSPEVFFIKVFLITWKNSQVKYLCQRLLFNKSFSFKALIFIKRLR